MLRCCPSYCRPPMPNGADWRRASWPSTSSYVHEPLRGVGDHYSDGALNTSTTGRSRIPPESGRFSVDLRAVPTLVGPDQVGALSLQFTGPIEVLVPFSSKRANRGPAPMARQPGEPSGASGANCSWVGSLQQNQGSLSRARFPAGPFETDPGGGGGEIGLTLARIIASISLNVRAAVCPTRSSTKVATSAWSWSTAGSGCDQVHPSRAWS